MVHVKVDGGCAMRQLPGIKREAALWILLVTSLIWLVASLWTLNGLSAIRGAERDRLRREARVFGQRVSAKISADLLAGCSSSSFKRLLETTGHRGVKIKVKSGALFFGKRVLGAYPSVPEVNVPTLATGQSLIRTEGAGVVYLNRLKDSRTLILSFKSPRYEKTLARTIVMALSASCAGLIVFISIVWLVLSALRSHREVEATLEGAGQLKAVQGGDGDSTQTLITLFQQTVKELHQEKDKLEKLHAEDRQKAENIEGLAETLCNNLNAGYLLFDDGGRLVNFNGSGRSLLGLPVLLSIGGEGEKLLAGNPETLAILKLAMEGKEMIMKEGVKGAPGVLLQVVALPLRNSYGHLRGYLLILKDWTEMYRMRQALSEREALARLGEIAAGVAHEVRNALSTILANLELMGQDDPSLKENSHFSALEEESSHLEKVVRNLLFYARPLPVKAETFNLKTLLQEETSILATSFQGVTAEEDCPPNIEITANRKALRGALRNLGRNAAEAIRSTRSDGGRVRFSCVEEKDRLAVLIEDDGPGIPEELLDKIFAPFSSEKPGGTGLGLAIAKKIAREHGGDLVVHSSVLGGAGFLLTLPSGNG